MRPVRESVFRVKFNPTRHLPRNSAAKVVSELVLAAVGELPAQRKTRIKTCAPPHKKWIAGRPRNRSVGTQTPGAMKESRPEQNISTVLAGDRNINNGIQREIQSV